MNLTMTFIKKILVFLMLISASFIANADANPDVWPYIKRKNV